MACLRGIVVASSLLVLLMALMPSSHAAKPPSPPPPSGGNPPSPPPPSNPSPPPPSDPSPPPPSHGNPHSPPPPSDPSPPPPSDPSPPPPSHGNPHSPPPPSDPSPPPPSDPSPPPPSDPSPPPPSHGNPHSPPPPSDPSPPPPSDPSPPPPSDPSPPPPSDPSPPPPSDPSPPPPSDPSPPPPSHGNPHSPPPPSDPSPPPPSDPSPPPPSDPSPPPPSHGNPHSPPPPSDPSPPPPSPPSNPSPHPDGNPPSHSPAPEGPYPCEHDLSSSCRNHYIGCPPGCPTNCSYNCRTCTSNCRCHMIGGICQDPRFVGGDGVVFYFHGKRDSTFCLVSDSGLHINALFIGKEREGGLKRDFTWVKSLGIAFGSHKLYVGANKVAKWDDDVDQLSIAFDSTPVVLPLATRSSFEAPEVGLQIIRNKATNSISVEVQGLFAVEASVVPITAEESRVHKYGITDDDCFAHLELHFRFFHLSSKVQGVLGQTYAPGFVTHVKRTSAMPIMGGERLYATSSLFATDCQVSQFGLPLENSYANKKDFPAIRCGMGDLSTGAGIVCRR